MALEKLPTPKPGEHGVRLWVDRTVMTPYADQQPQQGVTKLKDFAWSGGVGTSEGYGDFVFTQMEGPDAQGRVGFTFLQDKTDDELWTPFETVMEDVPEPWDTVVLSIEPYADVTAPETGEIVEEDGSISTFNKLVWKARLRYIAGGTFLTRKITKQYFGPRPFEFPRKSGPVPRALHLELPGGRTIDFPECLRDEIVIRPMQTTTVKTASGGAVGLNGVMREQIFEATNFITWQRHVKTQRQQQVLGGWLAIVEELLPPDQPEPEEDTVS